MTLIFYQLNLSIYYRYNHERWSDLVANPQLVRAKHQVGRVRAARDDGVH